MATSGRHILKSSNYQIYPPTEKRYACLATKGRHILKLSNLESLNLLNPRCSRLTSTQLSASRSITSNPAK